MIISSSNTTGRGNIRYFPAKDKKKPSHLQRQRELKELARSEIQEVRYILKNARTLDQLELAVIACWERFQQACQTLGRNAIKEWERIKSAYAQRFYSPTYVN